MNIAIYENTFSKNFIVQDYRRAVDAIMIGEYASLIGSLRQMDDKAYRDNKKLLPAITWSGVFKQGTRLITTIESYSGLVVLDIDKLEPQAIEALKSQLSTDEYVRFCFVSPSGRGIKVLVAVNTGPDHHLAAFLHLQKVFEEKYQFKVDDSGKDICRLCYVSADDRAIYNERSELFEVDTRYGVVGTYTPNPALQNYQPSADLTLIFQVCTKWVNNTKTYTDGEKNIYIHALACALNRCGVPMEEAINLITTNLPTPDVKWHQSVKSAYFHNQHEHGSVQIRDLSNQGPGTFLAPPYVANYTDDVVKNDLMRITATLFYQKVPIEDIKDIVGKIARYYNKEGFIDLDRASLPALMHQAIQVLNQQMASHAAQTALKYETAEDIGRDIVKLNLQDGLVKTFIPEIDDAMYGGMMPGNFYGMIGLGGTFKSILSQFMAFKNAENGLPVLYLNGEMSKFQFYERLAQMCFGVDLRSELFHGRISEANIESFIDQIRAHTNGNLVMFNGTGFNRQNILSTIQHIEATTGKKIKFVVADGITQMDPKGKEEIQAAIFNAGELKEIAKETNTAIIGLLHVSGDAAAFTLRDTGGKARGGVKMAANMDGYFSTSLLVDRDTSNLENPDDVMYLSGKFYLRLRDKRTRTGIVNAIINVDNKLHLIQEMCDPNQYEFNKNRRN